MATILILATAAVVLVLMVAYTIYENTRDHEK